MEDSPIIPNDKVTSMPLDVCLNLVVLSNDPRDKVTKSPILHVTQAIDSL